MRWLALLGVALAPLAAGCDPKPAATCLGDAPRVEHRTADEALANTATLRLTDLGTDWTPFRPDQPLGVLRPPLHDLVETGRSESAVFARQGIAIRSSTTVFASTGDAAEALRRADAKEFAECLDAQLGGVALARERTPDTLIYRLTVSRQSEAGLDRVTVVFVQQHRALLVLEAVHGRGPRRELGRALLRLLTRL